jgi:uncharacterized membrane protein
MTEGAVIGSIDDRRGPGAAADDEGFVYPRRAQTVAYLRSAAGLIMVGVPMAFGDPDIVAVAILGAVALAFVVYGARTWLRGLARVRVDDDGISISGLFPATVKWDRLTAVKLSYYSTRRDGTGGWMQLNISGTDGKMTIESTLDGFVDVTRRVIAEALHATIELSATTRNNLRPLGIGDGRRE